MQTDKQIWHQWARLLHHWGMDGWVAAVLEAAGPMTVLGAQAVYVGQPLMRIVVSDEHLNSLAQLLEDPSQSRSFATFLRESSSS